MKQKRFKDLIMSQYEKNCSKGDGGFSTLPAKRSLHTNSCQTRRLFLFALMGEKNRLDNKKSA
jgi:hypothetical protein